MTLMPVNIQKAYFELQQLRKAVRKAERELIRCFARGPNRSGRTIGKTNARTSQKAKAEISVLNRALN